MKRYLYWCVNKKGQSYNFISKAFLPIGLKIKDIEGKYFKIIDRAEEEYQKKEVYSWDD